MGINVMNEARMVMSDFHTGQEEAVMEGVKKLKDGNEKSTLARTELAYLNGLLADMDPTDKTATKPISANCYAFMVNNHITISGQSAKAFFGNGANLNVTASKLTQVVAQVENFAQSTNSDSQSETQLINMSINNMNAALTEMGFVSRSMKDAWSSATS